MSSKRGWGRIEPEHFDVLILTRKIEILIIFGFFLYFIEEYSDFSVIVPLQAYYETF